MNISKEYDLQLREQARATGTPLMGAFELTGRCNFDCKMCFVHVSDSKENRSKELSTQQYLDIMQSAIDAGMLFSILSGGECLLRPDFKEIYLFLYTHGVQITIKTNGWLLNDSYIEFFKKYPPKEISITLYGSNDDSYETVTGQRAFSSVINTILKIHDAKLPLSVTITPSRYSLEDIPKVVSLLIEQKIHYGIVPYLLSPREGVERDNYYPTTEEMIQLMLKIRKLEGKPLFEVPNPLPPVGGTCTTPPTGINCSAGSYRFAITWDGYMTPCFSIYNTRFNIRSLTFTEAWNKILENNQKVLQPVECVGCAYANVCINCPAVRFTDLYSGHCKPEICEFTVAKAKHGLLNLTEPQSTP